MCDGDGGADAEKAGGGSACRRPAAALVVRHAPWLLNCFIFLSSPHAASYSHFNGTHCRQPTSGALVKRTTACQTRQGTLPTLFSRIVTNQPAPKRCKAGETPASGQCLSCPAGASLVPVSAGGGATTQVCVRNPCGQGQTVCGGYCVDSAFLDAAGFSSDSQCNAVFDRLNETWPVPACGKDAAGAGEIPPPPPVPVPVTGAAKYLTPALWSTMFRNVANPVR